MILKRKNKQSDRTFILGNYLVFNYKNLKTTQEFCTTLYVVLNSKIKGKFVPVTSKKEGEICFVRILYVLKQKWNLYLLTGNYNVRLEHLMH